MGDMINSMLGWIDGHGTAALLIALAAIVFLMLKK